MTDAIFYSILDKQNKPAVPTCTFPKCACVAGSMFDKRSCQVQSTSSEQEMMGMLMRLLEFSVKENDPFVYSVLQAIKCGGDPIKALEILVVHQARHIKALHEELVLMKTLNPSPVIMGSANKELSDE